MSARAIFCISIPRFILLMFPSSVLASMNSISFATVQSCRPKEIYIQLRNERDLRPDRNGGPEKPRALDLGAGAGVSTQALYDVGWKEVVAVDPSRLAWDAFAAGNRLPPSIMFEHASDEQYVAGWEKRREKGGQSGDDEERKFDLVVLNYAVNHDKAVRFAKLLLTPGGHLLAPTNVQENYWFSQQYEFMDADGKVLWTKGTLGSYAVLFQPDYTSASCQGQWCPQFRNDDAAKDLRL